MLVHINEPLTDYEIPLARCSILSLRVVRNAVMWNVLQDSLEERIFRTAHGAGILSLFIVEGIATLI
jgi:hypothetical protein